jgi:hypothetical protein
MPPDADELDDAGLVGLPADAPSNFGFVRMYLLILDVPLAVPEVPVAAGSFDEAGAWLGSMQPATVISSFFGDSAGRETGGDCGTGVRGGSPDTRGGCATGGACTARASNVVERNWECDCGAATNAHVKAATNIDIV